VAVEFPAFLQLRHQPDGSAGASFMAEIDRTLAPAERRFAEFSSEARRQLDQALSTKRNASGSLDLGAAEIRAAAEAQQQRAIAAREVAAATALAAREEGAYGQTARLSVAATEALAREEEQAARAALSHAAAVEQVQDRLNRQVSQTNLVTEAIGRGTSAQQSMINSQRASRVAFVQLGQQMQDVVIQAQMGTNAFMIFAQQVPQAAFALSGLEGSANRFQSRIGSVATFLSGPWGAAIFAATAVLGPFIYNLLQSGDAADRSGDAHRALTDVLSDAEASYEQVISALERYNQAQAKSREETLSSLAAQAEVIRTNLRNAASIREMIKANIELYQSQVRAGPTGPGGQGQIGALAGAAHYESQLAAQDALIKELVTSAENTTVQIAKRVAEVRSDNEALLREGFKELREQAENDLSGKALIARFTELAKQEKAAMEALRKSERTRRTRKGPDLEKQAQRLAEFGEDAAKKIAAIGDRFADLPPEVAKANRATRELDDIISDLERRKPEGFAQMIEEAERLKSILPEIGLDQAMERLREETANRLQIDRLLLAGREREAEVLDIMLGLEDRFGQQVWDRVEAVRALVDARHDEAEALERAYEVQGAYLDATRSIKNELTSLLSGEGADFDRIAKRLQGELAFEKIFGDIFRTLEDDIQGRFSASVDHVEFENHRAADAVGIFASAAIGAANDLRTGTVSSQVQQGLGAMGGTVPGSTGTPANDNGVIVVRGYREQTKQAIEGSNSVLGLTPEAYFDMVGRRLVQPLLSGFEGVIGNQLLRGLEGVLGGAAGGYLAGGPVGAVLGGLRGAAFEFGPDLWGKALNDKILGGIGGAMQGAQTDAILGALGIQSSKTGAMIGGAAGSFLGPVGSLIGSIGGGLLGGLFKKKPYGTAVLTGLDGYSVSGNKGSAREGAGTLAGSVQQALGSIIDELGADLGSFRVSIGTYKDNIRVSTRGDTGKLGGYKGSESENERRHGLYNFGDDMEAAIAFAVKTAIDQGAVAGLKASELSLLKAGDDLQAAMQDVFDFRDVFTRLKSYKDPVGAALDELDSEFGRLEDLFDRANASAEERAQLAELYEIERAQAIEQAMERVGGSLRDLLKDLTIGDSGLSLRDRRANALTEYEALADRVRAGDVTAFDKYAEAARALLEIEREIFGSQEGYFDRFEEVRDLTKQTLEAQEALANASANRDSPFTPSAEPADDTKPVVDSIHWLGDHLVGELGRTLGDKLDAMTASFNRLAAANPSTPRHASGLSLLRAPGNY